MVIITIDTEHDAFHPDPAPELVIILSRLQARVSETSFATDELHLPISDTNGNRVGTLHWRRTE